MRGRRGAEISVTIKDCQIEDIQTLEQLFPVIADEQDLLRSVLTSPNLQASYIAYINGSPAGLAIAWKNSFHPTCTYIRIWTDPIYEQFEGRKKLLQKLRQLKGSPLQTSLWETNTIMKARNGYFQTPAFV
ncbi:hypothetical protein ACFSMW_15470 [Virgibacillus halophilus]|uniref:GNAT family N-acetyltransferase n=1 Tax=Tigheibacillus halophilus TaxID=361280 RepID=A0ABU5CCE3_9BACI|nr:hypothetical protein [Virgibacillus halophilus]